MNKLFKCLMLCFMILSLVACGSYEEGVNLSKDGTMYEVASEVNVYYPKKWQVVALDATEMAVSYYSANHIVKKDPKGLQVDFYSEDASEVLRFNRVSTLSDNTSEELIQLFCEDLSLTGIEATYQEATLNNGVACYEVLGVYKTGDRQFKWVVTYRNSVCYTYFYGASSADYEKKIESMSEYLYSMEIQE